MQILEQLFLFKGIKGLFGCQPHFATLKIRHVWQVWQKIWPPHFSCLRESCHTFSCLWHVEPKRILSKFSYQLNTYQLGQTCLKLDVASNQTTPKYFFSWHTLRLVYNILLFLRRATKPLTNHKCYMHVRSHQPKDNHMHRPECHASYDSAQRQMNITITFVDEKHT